eukprot:scaffold41107_cov17-Tisochrysis_lutea.AAC.2
MHSDLPVHSDAPPQPIQPLDASTASNKDQDGLRGDAHSSTATPQDASSDKQACALEQEQQQQEQKQQQRDRPTSARPASARSQSSHSTKHHPRTPPEQQPPPPKQQQQQQRSPVPTPAEDSDEDACIPRIELLPSRAPAPPQYHHKQPTPTQPRPRPASASASISRRSSFSTLTSSVLSQHNASSIYNGAQPLHGSLVAAPITPTSSQYGSAVRRPYSARDRPSSAMARQERHAEAVGDLMRRHPATWGVRDVGTWVEYIGLGQYRKKFMHHSVDGRLLLQVSDKLLKVRVLWVCCLLQCALRIGMEGSLPGLSKAAVSVSVC